MALMSPDVASLSTLLEMILGESIDVECLEVGSDLKSLACPYGSLLVDDADEVVGVILADLTAAVSLGGQLMMLPVGGLENQIETSDPTSLVIDAVSEVFNNVTLTMNTIEGNPHVRPRQAREICDIIADGHDWISSAREKTEFLGEFLCGQGRVQVISK